MANKRDRQATILELITGTPVASQEELRSLLRQRGWSVTQSTLSRDIQELRLARVSTGEGTRYQRGEGSANESTRPALDALLPQLLTRIDGVRELLVLHTPPGGAQPVALAIDREPNAGVLGTIAGDDTILIICRSTEARERLARRLRTLSGRRVDGAGE
jgi:transcriptional regulator of arginine metabolism